MDQEYVKLITKYVRKVEGRGLYSHSDAMLY